MTKREEDMKNDLDHWVQYLPLAQAIHRVKTQKGARVDPKQFGDVADVVDSVSGFQGMATIVQKCVNRIVKYPDSPAALVAARVLSEVRSHSSLVLSFCVRLLHTIVINNKVGVLSSVTVEVVRAISRYGEEARAHTLDVLSVLLQKDCPPDVKTEIIDFLTAVEIPNAPWGFLWEVADKSDDPVIRQWSEARRLRVSPKGGEALAQ